MQNSSLTCADAQHLIHLAVGDDTLPDEEKRLAAHLHGCAECRAYQAGAAQAMHVLEQVRDNDSAEIPAGAVWAAIADKVPATASRLSSVPERRHFNGAVAALCACSLALALVTVIRNLPVSSPEPAGSYVPAMSVGNPASSGRTDSQRLVPVTQPNGRVVFVDASTGQVYVPDVLSSLPDDPNASF